MDIEPGTSRPTVLHLLAPDEDLHVEAAALEGVLALTDRRLVISNGERAILDIAYEGLRRVQYDLERGRAATLVIVPESPHDLPQVLTIPDSEYRAVAEALVVIGARFGQE